MSQTAWLRRPTAIAWLLGGTFAAALVVAITLASWRSLFDGLVREKYGTADAAAQATIGKLVAGQSWTANTIELEQLYRHFMRGDAALDEFGGRLAKLAPEWLASRIERTLAAGTFDQRCRALQLARTTKLTNIRDALERAEARARQVADQRLLAEITATSEALR